MSGVDISYLGIMEQEWLLSAIRVTNTYPNGHHAVLMKEYFSAGKLTEKLINTIMTEQKAGSSKVIISADKISKYFPKEYNKQEIINIILQLLEDNWRNGGGR